MCLCVCVYFHIYCLFPLLECQLHEGKNVVFPLYCLIPTF